MFTPATIKTIQDIMRQDIGVDGDATRLSQMVWLIYLKILDDEDKALEIRKENFIPTLPKKYQWRTWAGPLDGITGDKLIEFVNNDLLPGLRELPESGNKRTDLTRMAFQDVYNFMRKGTLLKQVINKINEIDFNASKDRHAFNEIYERLLKSLQSAGNFGEMYTPRAVTQFIVEMVDPKIGESVLDPAVGTGGFLVHSLEHMRKQVKSVKDEQKVQQSIHGVEKKPLPFMLLITNMMLHGIEEPVTMRRGNTLERPLREYTDADKVSCIVTNPPFGGTEEPGIESNFPKEFQTRETADLFLVLIMRLLKKNGRAGIVLPDTLFFGEGMKTALKKELLEECNLHTIVRLPKSVFAPYTSIATNLLFFTKGEPTKEIWYYEHPFPEGQKAYSMTNPIRMEEFDVEKEWWSNRQENDRAWKVSIEEIIERDYNLDIKNPRTAGKAARTILSELEKYWQEEELARKVGKEISVLIGSVLEDLKTNPAGNEVRLAVDHIDDLIRIPDGIRHLESNLLALAVSGHLVPQDPKDTAAEILYGQIQKEKDAQISDRARNAKLSRPVTPEEIPFDIPSSWKWARIGDLFRVDNGFAFKSGNYVDSGVRVIRITNVQDGLIVDNNPKYISEKEAETYTKYALNENDLLMSLTGNVGRVGLIKKDMLPAVLNQRVARLFPWSASVKPFLYTYFKSALFQQEAQSGSRGMAQANMSTEWLKEYPIPLPPLSEQKRIVKKVEEIMDLIKQLREIIV